MPADVQIEIGPTVILPLPRNYLAATERFSPRVRLVELPNGGLTMMNYGGGIPFPNPIEPHKGWKTLANVWYRYIPHLSVDIYGSGCASTPPLITIVRRTALSSASSPTTPMQALPPSHPDPVPGTLPNGS